MLVLCHGTPAHHSAVEKLRWILKPADVRSGRGDQKLSKGGGIQHATTGLMTAAGPVEIQKYASSGLATIGHLASTNLIHQQFGRICLVEIVHRWSINTNSGRLLTGRPASAKREAWKPVAEAQAVWTCQLSGGWNWIRNDKYTILSLVQCSSEHKSLLAAFRSF